MRFLSRCLAALAVRPNFPALPGLSSYASMPACALRWSNHWNSFGKGFLFLVVSSFKGLWHNCGQIGSGTLNLGHFWEYDPTLICCFFLVVMPAVFGHQLQYLPTYWKKYSIHQVSGFRAVTKKGCQDSEVLRANRIKRKWHHQKRMSWERHVKDKGVQEITQSTVVTARRSGFVPPGSLFFCDKLLPFARSLLIVWCR